MRGGVESIWIEDGVEAFFLVFTGLGWRNTAAVVSASCSHVSHLWISSVEVPIKKAHERFMRLYRGCDSYCGGGVVAGFFLLLFLVGAGVGVAAAGVGSAGAASSRTVVPAGNIQTSAFLLELALVRVSIRFGVM